MEFHGIYDTDGTIWTTFSSSEDVPKNYDSFSLSIWFQIDSNKLSEDAYLVTYGKNGNENNCFQVRINLSATGGRKIIFGSSSNWTSSGNYYQTSQDEMRGWHHACFTYDSSTYQCQFYLDGELKNQHTMSSINISDAPMINVGGGYYYYFSSPYFHGWKSSLRIYNRVLKSNEIKNLSKEFIPKYRITAADQTFRFTPVSSSKDIAYSATFPVSNFEIISGQLPNTISLNSSNGKFTGSALTDADHTYNLVVRMSGENVEPKQINVTINTVQYTDFSVPSPQTFDFTTEEFKAFQIQLNKEEDIDNVSISYEGSPNIAPGCYISKGTTFDINSNGNQTSASSTSKVVEFWSTYHPQHVSATINVNIQLNRITVPNQTLKFYIDDGPLSLPIEYTSQKQITPVYSMNGTLPNGFTFNSTSGTIDYDGVYSAPTTGFIDVYVDSSTGSSIQGAGYYTIQLLSGSNPIPSGVWLYCPCSDATTFECKNFNVVMGTNGSPTFYTAAQEGRDCVEFNGSPKNIAFNNVFSSPSIPVGNQPRSVNYWIKCPSNMGFPSSLDRSINIFSYGQGNAWKAFRSALHIKTQDLSAYNVSQDCYNGIPGGTFIVGTSDTIPLYPNGFDTNWHMITITYDSTNFKIYRDSTLVAHKQLTGQFKTGKVYTLVLGIGSPGITSWNYFYANPGYRLSSFRMWKRALTDQEVAKLYLQ